MYKSAWGFFVFGTIVAVVCGYMWLLDSPSKIVSMVGSGLLSLGLYMQSAAERARIPLPAPEKEGKE